MSSEKGRMFSHLQWKNQLRIEKMLEAVPIASAPSFTAKIVAGCVEKS